MEKEVTIVIIQRNMFSTTMMNLNSVYDNTDIPFDLIYLDAGSPSHIQKYLIKESAQKKFRYFRSRIYLPPNIMRKMALDLIKTPFALFLDNDCTVNKGWLSQLIATAKETNAWLVGPVYLENVQGQVQVHMMGGRAGRAQHPPGYRYLLNPDSPHIPESACDVPVSRFETELLEFHCILLNLDQFPEKPPVDEKLYSMHEHNDLCLYVLKKEGPIIMDPKVKVTFLDPPPFKWYDLPVFFIRWSERWNRLSLYHFKKKWSLTDDDPSIPGALFYGSKFRRKYLFPARKNISKLLGERMTDLLFRYCVYPLEKRINRLLVHKDPLKRPVRFTEFSLSSN